MKYQDILFDKRDGVAKVTINRPERYNAFRIETMEELIHVFDSVSLDPEVLVLVLTAAGDKAFCAGGDGAAMQGKRDMRMASLSGRMFTALRNVVQPTIAAVNGVAVGGGNILQFNCDLSIASETARFGQVDPKAGSWGGGFATAYLSRVIGEKKAREMWFMCRKYSAQEALQMGLVNKVVPADQLQMETLAWCEELKGIGRIALRTVKATFNADTEHMAGFEALARCTLRLAMNSDEAMMLGQAAFSKQPADLTKIPFDW